MAIGVGKLCVVKSTAVNCEPFTHSEDHTVNGPQNQVQKVKLSPATEILSY